MELEEGSGEQNNEKKETQDGVQIATSEVQQKQTTPPKKEPLKNEKQKVEAIRKLVNIRTYVCDKCKWCDEFLPSPSSGNICQTCGCTLISHIKDADEDEDSDPQEWVDDEEEEDE